MADLAKLVVRLEAQSAQLLSELDKANSRIARFERNASGSLDKLNKKFERFGFGVKTAIGTFLAGVSFTAIVKANEEAAESFAQLENAVERAGSAAGGRNARQFSDAAKQIASLTTETGGAVQGVQALLLRFQNIRTDRFDDATRSVLDFAAATRRDLGSAAELVGKALSSPEKGMTALAKAGVVFSESQQLVIKDLVETGRRAEAQGIILDGLNKRFGGAAEAARNNFGGALKAVRNALGDLMESDTGLPGATEAMNDLAKTLQDPAVKAGADQLFSLLITGAAKAASLIGQTAAGIGVLFNKTGDRVEELEKQIRFLEEQRDSFLSGVANFGGTSDIFPEGGVDALFGDEAIQRKIDELTDLQGKILGLGEAGIETAKNLKGASDALAGAFELPDIEVVDNTKALAEAAEKLQKQLEAAGKSLTEQLETPLERYNRRVAEADKLLAANTITLETWARALGAARGELDDLSSGMLQVNERFKTLDEQISESFDEDIRKMLDDSFEQMGEDITKEFDEALKRSEKAWSVFADQAARNTQDILADGIETALDEGFSKGLDGLLDNFGKMLERMAIQAVAADIAGKIFGLDENGKPGGGGGWFDKVLGWFDGIGKKGGSSAPAAGGGSSFAQGEWDWLDAIFGSSGGGGGGGGGWLDAVLGIFGSMDQGGRGRPGEPVMIGRGAQPELFVPDTAGEFIPAAQWQGGKAANVTQNIYTQGPLTPHSARQLEVEAARRQRTVVTRLG